MARAEMRKRTYKFTKAQLIFYGSYANSFFGREVKIQKFILFVFQIEINVDCNHLQIVMSHLNQQVKMNSKTLLKMMMIIIAIIIIMMYCHHHHHHLFNGNSRFANKQQNENLFNQKYFKSKAIFAEILHEKHSVLDAQNIPLAKCVI